jgi:hypothetical protein
MMQNESIEVTLTANEIIELLGTLQKVLPQSCSNKYISCGGNGCAYSGIKNANNLGDTHCIT